MTPLLLEYDTYGHAAAGSNNEIVPAALVHSMLSGVKTVLRQNGTRDKQMAEILGRIASVII